MRKLDYRRGSFVTLCFLAIGCEPNAESPTVQQKPANQQSPVRPVSHLEPPGELAQLALSDTATGATTRSISSSIKSSPAEEVLQSATDVAKTRMEVATHNLVNANTIAFKQSRVICTENTYRCSLAPGVQDSLGNAASTGTAMGLGVQLRVIQLDMSVGHLQSTHRPLDVAIDGEGFLQVTDPSGQTYYTRCGTFSINSNGSLCLCSSTVSRLLEPNICIPQDTLSISIGEDGIVSVLQFGSPQQSQVGQLQIAQFINYQGLRPLGEGLYAESNSSGPPIIGNPGSNAAGKLKQGALEASNVNLEEALAEYKQAKANLNMLLQLRSELP